MASLEIVNPWIQIQHLGKCTTVAECTRKRKEAMKRKKNQNTITFATPYKKPSANF